MSGNILTLLEGYLGLKSDYKDDWTETTKDDWAISWPNQAVGSPAAPVNTVAPYLVGALTGAQVLATVVGDILTVKVGTWTGNPAPTYTYQWKSNGTNVAGATGNTYQLQTSDIGNTITCTVSATNTVSTVTATTSATNAVIVAPSQSAPTVSSVPVITGTATTGSVLTASLGDYTGYPYPTYQYQWLSGGVPVNPNIVGNNGLTASYMVQASDIGNTITVQVTASNMVGSVVATSTATAAVTSAQVRVPFATKQPSVSGLPFVGSVLTIAKGNWEGMPLPTFTYEWVYADESTINTLGTVTPGSGYGDPIATTGSLVAGTGYTNGTYTGVALTGGTGTGALATVVVSGTVVTSVTVTTPGTGYVVGDTLSALASSVGGTGTGFSVKVLTTGSHSFTAVPLTGGSGTGAQATVVVTAGAVASVTITAAGTGYVAGDVLSAAASTIGGHGTGFSVPVLVAGTAISGATSNTYTLASGDVGHEVTGVVTATNSQGSVAASTGSILVIAAPTAEAPVNTAYPSITGTPTVGQTLTAVVGTWTGIPTPTYTYQWRSAGFAVTGATSSTYVPTVNDIGNAIDVVVTGTNASGATKAWSAPTNPIAAINVLPANTALPTISGIAEVNQILTVIPGTWTGYPTPALTYQWKSGGSVIAGATSKMYQVQVSDIGNAITCVETATNAAGTETETTTATSAVVAQNIAPANTVAPVITGNNIHGDSVSVSTGTWTGYPVPTYTYQWINSASGNISGATSSSYTLQSSDIGDIVSVKVTATNSQGSASTTVAMAVAVV